MDYEKTTDGFTNKIKELFKEEKYKKLIIIAGLIGIALIFLSSFFTDKNSEQKSEQQQNITVTSQVSDYKSEIEQNLADIISTIEGAGTTKVMVTVESSAELIYATDQKTDIKSSKGGSGDSASNESDNSTQSSYITVKLSDGTEQAVLLKEVQPQIRGVLVVCSGGGDSVIHQRVLEAVTKALNISSAKVCVTKLSQ